MKYSIRDIELFELKDIFRRIEKDFAKGEYAPYDILYQQIQSGVQKGLILLEGEHEVAYSICAENRRNGYILISLLAVYEELRGSGFGTAFLEELKHIYTDKMGIIVEVEKPEDTADPKETAVRTKRIEFYKKAGYYIVPNIDYSIWDVPMHLMVLPLKSSKEEIDNQIGQIIYDIYFSLMGKRFIHKLQFKRLTDNHF